MKHLENLLAVGIILLHIILPAAVAFAEEVAPPPASPSPAIVAAVPQPEAQSEAPPKTRTRIEGEWPRPIPNVSLDLRDVPVQDVLAEIATKAGLDLVMTQSEGAQGKRITLSVKDRLATEATELALAAADLEAKIDGKTLLVRPGEEGETEEEAEPAAEEQTEGAAERDHKGGPKIKVKIEGDADDRVVTGQDGRVEAGETVGDAVAIDGSMTVAGHVKGDAVAIGGGVTLEPSAVVNGDAVAIGGKVEVSPGAVLRGDRVTIAGSMGGMIGSLVHLGSRETSLKSFVFDALSTLARAVALLVLGLLILAFMPERAGRIREYMVTRPGASFLGGLGIVFGFVPLCIVLAITLIGIPLIPVAFLALVALLVVGLTTAMVWLGYRIPIFDGKKSAVVALLLGLAVCTLVDLVPLAGTPIVLLAGFAGAGAAILSRFGRNQAKQVAELAGPQPRPEP